MLTVERARELLDYNPETGAVMAIVRQLLTPRIGKGQTSQHAFTLALFVGRLKVGAGAHFFHSGTIAKLQLFPWKMLMPIAMLANCAFREAHARGPGPLLATAITKATAVL